MRIRKIIKNIKLEYIVIAIIILFAAIFRLDGVFTNSFPFTYDIGRDMLAAREIASFTKFPLIGQTTGLPGLFYGPTWHYFLAILYVPLFGDPKLFTAFIALTGVLTSFLGYILGKKIGGAFLGISFASLLAFSPVVISLTSQVWHPYLIPVLWISIFLILYGIFKNKQTIKFPFILGILLSLIADMEIVVGLLFCGGILISLLIALPRFFSVKRILVVAAGFLLVLSPRIIFDFRHQHILSSTLFTGINNMFLGNGGSGVTNFQVTHKLSLIYNLWSETVAAKNPYFGAIILLVIILVLFLNLRKANETIKFFTKIILGTTFVTIVGILFFSHDIWSHYLVALPLLFVFILAIALNFLYQNKKWTKLSVITILVLALININPLKKIIEYSTPLWEGDAAVYRNQVNAVDYVYTKANGTKFKYIVYTPPVYDYTYQYLFTWYGQKKYGYIPTDKDPQYLFVILEPDYEYPIRLKNWLKIRVNDGKIVKEEKLKGGLIVQTRLLKQDEKK